MAPDAGDQLFQIIVDHIGRADVGDLLINSQKAPERRHLGLCDLDQVQSVDRRHCISDLLAGQQNQYLEASGDPHRGVHVGQTLFGQPPAGGIGAGTLAWDHEPPAACTEVVNQENGDAALMPQQEVVHPAGQPIDQ